MYPLTSVVEIKFWPISTTVISQAAIQWLQLYTGIWKPHSLKS